MCFLLQVQEMGLVLASRVKIQFNSRVKLTHVEFNSSVKLTYVVAVHVRVPCLAIKHEGSVRLTSFGVNTHELSAQQRAASPVLMHGNECVHRKKRQKNCLHFSICACHPCAGAMLIFSVSFQF